MVLNSAVLLSHTENEKTIPIGVGTADDITQIRYVDGSNRFVRVLSGCFFCCCLIMFALLSYNAENVSGKIAAVGCLKSSSLHMLSFNWFPASPLDFRSGKWFLVIYFIIIIFSPTDGPSPMSVSNILPLGEITSPPHVSFITPSYYIVAYAHINIWTCKLDL